MKLPNGLNSWCWMFIETLLEVHKVKVKGTKTKQQQAVGFQQDFKTLTTMDPEAQEKNLLGL